MSIYLIALIYPDTIRFLDSFNLPPMYIGIDSFHFWNLSFRNKIY